MRRLLSSPPKAVNYEVIGNLARATVNATKAWEPFTFVPRRPCSCPVCGEESGNIENRISTIVSLEFSDAPILDVITWSHPTCFESCVETDEPDRDIE